MIDGRGRIESTVRILVAAGKRVDILRLRHVQWGLSTAIIATTESSFHTTYAMYKAHATGTSPRFIFFLITISARTRFDPRDSHCWRSLTERAGCASRSGYCTFNVASLGNIQDSAAKEAYGSPRAYSFTRVYTLANERRRMHIPFPPSWDNGVFSTYAFPLIVLWYVTDEHLKLVIDYSTCRSTARRLVPRDINLKELCLFVGGCFAVQFFYFSFDNIIFVENIFLYLVKFLVFNI